MSDLRGQSIGRYRLVGIIGRGGMADVYEAVDPAIDRCVAIKVLRNDLARDPGFQQRFELEARSFAKLEHPHIVPVYDYGVSEGSTYLVMRFLRGGALSGLVKLAPLPFDAIRLMIGQIASALHHAHANGVVHRDVKPENILLDENRNCLLADFGLARLLESGVHLTDPGRVLGTPSYMSPEQCRGGPVDERSDIYSLGIVLYQMATGRVPFLGETPIAVLRQHIDDPIPPARSLNPDIPEDLVYVIEKALAKNPRDRFQTARELALACEGAGPFSSPQVEHMAVAPTLAVQLPAGKSRRRSPWIAILVLSVAFSVPTGYLLRPLNAGAVALVLVGWIALTSLANALVRALTRRVMKR